MDIETRIELIKRAPAEEIISEEELRHLLETKTHPVAYNGWEPSGLVHLGTGLICAYKMKDLIEAGIHFKAYLATWHAWINNKLGGDINLIKVAAEHFKHSWASLGVPIKSIEFIYADDVYNNGEYWKKTVSVAKKLTISRTARTLEIAGRKDIDARYVSDLMYTPMQVADIFEFGIDICALGTDQRKANIVAREVGPGLGYWKPVCLHHHLLQGLQKPPIWPIPKESESDVLSSIKMSKSKPETCIFIYDSPEDIKNKMNIAFCPETLENNPIIDICKHIVFREGTLNIERQEKYGGDIEIHNFEELTQMYKHSKLHPQDLKNGVASALIDILEPTRIYFKKKKKAGETLDIIKNAVITR